MIPSTPFKDYIRANQIDTGYYYDAMPRSGQRDIKLASKLAASLRTADPGCDDAALAVVFERILAEKQGGLLPPLP